MKMLIVPIDRVEKLKSMYFDGRDEINPIEGYIEDKQVWFLPENLKYVDKFSKVFVDFEVCEVKEIEKVECVNDKTILTVKR